MEGVKAKDRVCSLHRRELLLLKIPGCSGVLDIN